MAARVAAYEVHSGLVTRNRAHRPQLQRRRGTQRLAHDRQELRELGRGLELSERDERPDADALPLRAGPATERLEALIAEVSNTPRGERHAYAMRRTADQGEGRVLSGSFDKQLHVSPFMGMEQSYMLRAAEPGDSAAIHIESTERGRRAFDATLSLRRVALTRRSLA